MQRLLALSPDPSAQRQIAYMDYSEIMELKIHNPDIKIEERIFDTKSLSVDYPYTEELKPIVARLGYDGPKAESATHIALLDNKVIGGYEASVTDNAKPTLIWVAVSQESEKNRCRAGTTMLLHHEKKAIGNELKEISLTTSIKNTRALSLYEFLGYQRGEELYGQIWMIKTLHLN